MFALLYDPLGDNARCEAPSVVDEVTRECLAIHVGRLNRSTQSITRLTDSLVQRGMPEFLRSDIGSEFTAATVHE